MARSKSSDRWLRRHFTDEYVKRAQKEGKRSRAAYKLAEMDERDRLFRPGMTVVDLGAAPGGWAEYVVSRVSPMGTRRGPRAKDGAPAVSGPGGRVIALDILPMEPIAGVEVLQGDFTEQAVLDSLIERLDGHPVDLVIADMAPNISGIASADQGRSMLLAELALEFADKTLRPGGDFLVKTFQGAGFQEFHRAMQRRFTKLHVRKPKASRAESREVYLLGKGFKGH